MASPVVPTGRDHPEVSRLFELRTDPASDLAGQAGAVAGACHAMAARFQRRGKLIVFGTGGASTDAQHVAVEFVHPVIVGKRALPAIALTTDVATVTGIAEREGVDAIFAHQIPLVASPEDIALGICADGDSPAVLAGLRTAAALGLLTIALTGANGANGANGARRAASMVADHVLTVSSADPRVVKEMQVTTYHILWELVHVFFEQPGVLDPGGVTGETPRDAACHAGTPHDETCITCSDVAVQVKVTRLLPDDLAMVDTGRGEEEVSVALVTVAVGDTILVHAGEAIAFLGR